MWSRWDAGWYLEIAKRGYHYEPSKPSSVAFFPLYPGAVRLLHDLLFLPASDGFYLGAGIALSNFCLIISLVYLRALLSLDYNPQVTRRVLLFILLFPTSFFFSAVYSESLFLLLTLSSFFYARKQRWVMACALATLATLSRSQGIILIAPLLVEYLAQRQWKLSQIRWDMTAFFLIPSAVVAFCCYLRWSFGSWTLLFEAQRPWGRRLLAPWYTLRWIWMHASASAGVRNDWIDLAFFALLGIATILSIRKLRASYSVYLCAAIVFFSSWGMLGSLPRFILVNFPLFIGLALFAERYVFRLVYLAVSSALSALFFIMFSQWQWVA
jgi:Gpi18-like mannosyltransferase